MIVNILRPVHFRGKLRLFRLFGARYGVRTIALFGSTVELDLAESGQRHIYQGTFEPHETRLVRKYLKAGMTFVDAGANVGYYTALGSYLTGAEGRVVAFDPSPYAFARLKRMIDRNALKTGAGG